MNILENLKQWRGRIVLLGCLLVGPVMVFHSHDWIGRAAGLPIGPELLVHQATEGDVAAIRASLNSGVSPNSTDELGTTALHCAISSGNRAAVQALIDAGADVNEFACCNSSPLTLAVSLRHPEIVAALLRAHANPNQATRCNLTPLCVACITGEEEIARMLLDAGADVNGRCASGMTPTIAAAASYADDTSGILRELLRAGADVNRADNAGNTPLMEAAKRGRLTIVLLLLKSGADPIRRNHDDANARMLAENQNNWQVAEVLSKAEGSRRA